MMNLTKEEIKLLKSLLEFELKQSKVNFMDGFRYSQKGIKNINKAREQIKKILIKLKGD